jgi:ADP-ribosylglycohydrolase/fructose-1,6-bisphosphatase/inositol monophosphatase family enzyme
MKVRRPKKADARGNAVDGPTKSKRRGKEGPEYAHALEVAIEAAREAGDILRAELHRPGGPRGHGGHCPADREAEDAIAARLIAAFPKWAFLGEEGGGRNFPPTDHLFVVDPNDGTRAFVARGERGTAISIALLHDCEPVLGVIYAFSHPDDRGDLIGWAMGCPLTRNGKVVKRAPWATELDRSHTILVSQDADSASMANAQLVAPARFLAVPSIAYRLALAAVGDGEVGISLNGPVAWDFAGGHALLLATGGDLFDADGLTIRYTPHGSATTGSRFCFGGSPALAVELSRRDWRTVFERPSAKGKPERLGLVRSVRGKTVANAGLLQRAQGCLLGQLAGDALGSLVEFRSPEAIAGEYPDGVRLMKDGGTWNTIAGQPTDDSELALMLARSLIAMGRHDEEEVARAYGHWLESAPFDCGATIRQALSAAAQALHQRKSAANAARAAANASSQANGALMRIAPLAIFGHAMPPSTLAEWARRDAALTHPNTICADANAVYVVAIQHALATGSAEGTYAFALEWARRNAICAEVVGDFKIAKVDPPNDFVTNMGWVRIALQNAFFQLLHAATVEDAIADTISRGGDSDTTAAIAGSLLGAVHGRDGIPAKWVDRLLTCRPIVGLPGVQRPRPQEFWPVDVLVLAERLLAAGSLATP